MAIGRLGVSRALLVLLAPMAAQCQTDPALWRFVYPNAKALISINWQRIRQSPAVTTLREKLLSGGLTPSIPGIELLDSVDRILISSPGSPKSESDSVEPLQPPVLIAIHGHFDGSKVRKFFVQIGAKPQAYNSFQIYRPQKQGPKNMAWVLFDPETILLGDPPSLFATLDRNQFGPPVSEAGSMVARAAEMEAAYEFWLVMNVPEMASNDRLAAIFPGAELVADAQAFEAGINLRSGLTADITVRFGSEDSAKRVVTELTKLIAAAAKDKGAEAQVRDIAKKLKFVSEGPAAKISLRLTPQELEKSAQAFAEGRKQSMAAARNTGGFRNSQPVVIQAPSKPGVIRIEGLDGGPREIPYPDQQH
jgi:hypothetical protein